LAAADGAAHADSEGAPAEIARQSRFALVKVAGVFERVVSVAGRPVIVVRVHGELALEQPGIQPVLRSLPEIEEWRSLGNFFRRQVLAVLQNLFCLRPQPMLQRLGFERTNDAQAHSAREQSPQMQKEA